MIETSIILDRGRSFYVETFNITNCLSLWYAESKSNIIEEFSPCYGCGTHFNEEFSDYHISNILTVPKPIPFSISNENVFGMPDEFNSGFGVLSEYAIEEIHNDKIRIMTILDSCSDGVYHFEKISKKFFDFLINKVNLKGGMIDD